MPFLAALVITGTTPSAASTTAVVGTPVVFQVDAPESLDVNLDLIGATGGTLDLVFQTSTDLGVTWYDYAHLTQIAAGAGASKARWGATRGTGSSGVVVVGSGLTPALAAGTIVGGPFGDRMRLIATSGVGTTVGATITARLSCQGTNAVAAYPRV